MYVYTTKTCSTPCFDCRNELYAPDLARDMTLVGWKNFKIFRWPRDRRRVPFWSRGSHRGLNWSKCSLSTDNHRKIAPPSTKYFFKTKSYKHDRPVICGQCLGPLEHRKVVRVHTYTCCCCCCWSVKGEPALDKNREVPRAFVWLEPPVPAAHDCTQGGCSPHKTISPKRELSHGNSAVRSQRIQYMRSCHISGYYPGLLKLLIIVQQLYRYHYLSASGQAGQDGRGVGQMWR